MFRPNLLRHPSCESSPRYSRGRWRTDKLAKASRHSRDQQPQRARRGAPKALGPPGAGLDLALDQRGAGMADIPGGASGLLARDCKEADRLVTRIDPGGDSLVAELRAQERQAAEELGQWKTRGEERKPLR